MMPQNEASQTTQEQTGATYGKYEGDPAYTRQHDETAYEPLLRDGLAGKVYPTQPENKNLFRLLVFVIAMATLLAFGFLCLVLMGGTGGWISFCAASLAIFIIAVVAIDKIK